METSTIPTIRTVADLKRIPIGTRLRLTHSLMGPTPPEKQWRTVREVRSKDMIVEPDCKPGSRSYMGFPKASDLRVTAVGFDVYEDTTLCASYSFT